jgi:hypothetical protein
MIAARGSVGVGVVVGVVDAALLTAAADMVGVFPEGSFGSLMFPVEVSVNPVQGVSVASVTPVILPSPSSVNVEPSSLVYV